MDDLGVKCKDRARAKGWTIRNSLKIHASHAGLGGPISSSQPNRRHVLPFPQTHTGANPLFQSILVEPRSCLQESRLMFIVVRTADRKFYNILRRILSLTKSGAGIPGTKKNTAIMLFSKDADPPNDGFVALLHQRTRQSICPQYPS